MKDAILIALIACILQVFGSFYYMLTTFEVVKFNAEVHKIMQPIFFLSSLGLLIYFFQLYNKESGNR